MDNVDMDWSVMDKMGEILKEFAFNSPIFVPFNFSKGEYTKRGKLIEPYTVILNPDGNLGAIIKYREGNKEFENLGGAKFIPERINKLIHDFLRVGCKDFDLHF